MRRRNKFSLSHYKLLTCNMGELIPLTWFELLPSDSIRHQTSVLIRATPMLAPLMHPVMCRIHTFDVPIRIIWDNFPEFITGFDEDGTASTATYPYRAFSSGGEGELRDHLGLPNGSYSPSLPISILPFRAYASIYNNYYRDTQLVSEVALSKADGNDTTTNITLQKVSWEKDFFTTARPNEQLGSDITIPLGTSAPIKTDSVKAVIASAETQGIIDANDADAMLQAHSGDSYKVKAVDATADENLYADLSAATGLSITALREYFALQRYAENLNERGHRYVEYLNWQFGIRTKQDWLPNYVSGGKKVLQFSEVLGTAGGSGGDAIGTLKGHGIGALRTRRSRSFIKEHCIRMVMMSLVPKAIYATGLPRKFSREEKEDYFTPELELIGDRAIKNKEVWAEHGTPDGTFGYQQRYDSYRTGPPSGIAGEFRSTLNYWHYARIFGGAPSLNQTFIECDPTKRQYADNSNDSFYVMANHSIQARRPMSKFPKKRII